MRNRAIAISALVAIASLSGCARLNNESNQRESPPAPTKSAPLERERSIEIQTQVRDLIPPASIDQETSNLPKIGEKPRLLNSCSSGFHERVDEPAPGAVYYSGLFIVVVSPTSSASSVEEQLTSSISTNFDWQKLTYTQDNAPDMQTWETPDGFTIDIYSDELTDKNRAELVVSVTSPCFVPQPPYKAGDEI
ncbi:hypothetical protein [Gulosibacter bifidus]|uniref:Secreted protein n=1 Tax=Gulosibacter bifidus TaxID=272239 RepID=A0ABW5RJB0_9MICO|nr:hypothetical protein [Gulosibacter bifidus]